MLTLCLSLLLLITNNSNNSQITDKKEIDGCTDALSISV